jgi:serine/threonine protein kinase
MIPDGRPSPNGAGAPGTDGEYEREDELAAALDAYLAEVEAGRPVDPEEWVRRHPEIAGRLRACLRGLHLVEAAAEALDITPAAGVGIDRSRSGLEPSGAGPDPVRIGDFEVVRELGRGGMGVVYEAVERSLSRRVALKVLPLAAAIDPRQIARFRVEAQAASQLNHPHIVPVYSVGCTGGVHYYAMRLIEGPTLAQLIAGLRRQDGRHHSESTTEVKSAPTVSVVEERSDPDGASPSRAGPSSRPATTSTWSLGAPSIVGRSFFREAARLGREAAEALEHAHQQGVLHRDVKPSNLMVDAPGHLWVTDFGLARFQGDSSLTAPGDLLGTLRYMSPEQATADHAVVDRRTDVYSLGATLYELITLHPVFAGNDRQELLRRITQEEPRRPRAVQPAVPRDLETIVLKAMAKDPAGRYATAQAIADDLGRFLDDRPILARRPGPMERSARWIRRHAAGLAIAVPLLAATVVALGIAFAVVVAKNAVIVAKQAEIERAQADVRRRADEARRAVDDMYTQVAENWLGRQPALQDVQREFLLKALASYERFAAEPGADPRLRAEAGTAALRVGEIQRTLGRRHEAERAYLQAIAALGAIPAASAGPEVVESLGKSCGGLGQLLKESGREAEARPVLERAIELTGRYIMGSAGGPVDEPHRVAGYHRLGTLLRLSGRDAAAESAYRRTIELARAMGGPRGLKMQAGAQGNLGELLTLTGRRDEAEGPLRQAVTLYESMVRREPEIPVFRQELARALDRLGVLAARRPGARPEAERLIRQALALCDRLAADSPDVQVFREDLGLTLLDLVDVLTADGRPGEAEPFAARSAALYEELTRQAPPGSAGHRRRLVWALDRLSGLLLSPAVARTADAESVLRRSVDCREALIAEGAGEPADRAAIAAARGRLGALLAARGESAEARRTLEQAAEGESSPTTAATYLLRCVDLAARDESLSSEARAKAMRDDAGRAHESLRRAVPPGLVPHLVPGGGAPRSRRGHPGLPGDPREGPRLVGRLGRPGRRPVPHRRPA